MSLYDISLLSVYVILTLLGIISLISCHISPEQNRGSLFPPMHTMTCVSVVPVTFAGDICNSVEDSISWKKVENLHVMSCFDKSVLIMIKHNKMIPTQCSHTF